MVMCALYLRMGVYALYLRTSERKEEHSGKNSRFKGPESRVLRHKQGRSHRINRQPDDVSPQSVMKCNEKPLDNFEQKNDIISSYMKFCSPITFQSIFLGAHPKKKTINLYIVHILQQSFYLCHIFYTCTLQITSYRCKNKRISS